MNALVSGALTNSQSTSPLSMRPIAFAAAGVRSMPAPFVLCPWLSTPDFGLGSCAGLPVCIVVLQGPICTTLQITVLPSFDTLTLGRGSEM